MAVLWPELASAPWMVAFALLLLVLGLLLGFARWRSGRASGRGDRYTPERILLPEQEQMLDYLREAFPERVVLPNVRLRDMLSVRRAANRKLALERLASHSVDFVLCGPDGRPLYAFDVERYHLSNAKYHAHQLKLKDRILKTAGVRLVHLKNSSQRMPSPQDFRRQLNLVELPQPMTQAQRVDSVRQQLDSQLSSFDRNYPSSAYSVTEVMSLSQLMDLDQDRRQAGENEPVDLQARRRSRRAA
jgi:Protein of unknown function (DUF2726)